MCSRYGLQVGAYSAWFVRALMWLCFVIAWPISKILDVLLGHEQAVHILLVPRLKPTQSPGHHHRHPRPLSAVTVGSNSVLFTAKLIAVQALHTSAKGASLCTHRNIVSYRRYSEGHS